MKNLLLGLMATLMFAGMSSAQVQVQTVQKPKSDVNAQSYESKLTTTGYSFKYLADGNKGRAGISIGEGLPVSRLVSNLPNTLGDFRLVPLVTLDASAPASSPRTTFALLAPKVELFGGVEAQVGLAGNGLDARSWTAVHGLQTYVGVNVNFSKLSKTLGLKKALGL